MKLDVHTGLLQEAIYLVSPNCDDRPPDSPIDMIVVHGISLPPGEFGGHWIDDFFTNCLDKEAHPYFQEIHEQRVSSHFLIRRDGSLTQYVPVTKRAWHAGQSCFDGRERCNDFSVGIELEGTDDCEYKPAQYATLAELSACLMGCYPEITPDRITGHSDIAPDRKTDPGKAFDWKRFHTILKERLGSPC